MDISPWLPVLHSHHHILSVDTIDRHPPPPAPLPRQFVELKGSVFKKFDRNNLLQVACSDIRERFQYCILLLLVVVQTMKEFGWSEGK